MIDRTREAGLDITTGRATLHDDPIWDSRLLILDTTPTDLTDQSGRPAARTTPDTPEPPWS